MKRKMKIKEFLTRKKVAAGCVAAAAVIAIVGEPLPPLSSRKAR